MTSHPADPFCPCDACAWLARQRAICPVCGEAVHCRQDGTVASHGWISTADSRALIECMGTGQQPARILEMVGEPPGGAWVAKQKLGGNEK